MKKIHSLLLSALLLFGGGEGLYAQHGKYVGGDISLLSAYEKAGNIYLDEAGQQIPDLITWLTNDCKWNAFRLRIFVNPSDPNYEGVVQDLDYVKALGKRIKEAGAYFMLDFHYSDTWVDATHIQAPEAWKSLSTDQKAQMISQYTHETLKSLKEAGAQPDMVQVGNEIMYGFMGVKVAPYETSGSQWDDFLKILKTACEAVRSECPEAEIVIHTDRPTNADYAKYWYGKLDAAGVDYDVIGLSYYPFWHGTLTDLQKALKQMNTDFPQRKVQIVETAYNFQYWPSSGINYDTRSIWPCSADGQHKYVGDLIAALTDYEQVEGFFYWCPEEAGCGDNANWNTYENVVIKNWLNRGLWWSENNNGHWPLSSGGVATARLLKDFLSPTSASIKNTTSTPSPLAKQENVFNISGQRVSHSYQGIVVRNGRKHLNVSRNIRKES